MKQPGAEGSPQGMKAYSIADAWEVAPTDPTGPRFCIEEIYPCVDCGRYPVKRIAGEAVDLTGVPIGAA